MKQKHALPSYGFCLAGAIFSAFLASATCSFALEASVDDLTNLSLEALMDIDVTSVSRKPQKLANVAAAAFVITQDDIRRSGATTIPELLRMVPGVQVARIDSNKWAVSIRGFNGRFSNKLLVLKDGRSIYTPLFSGVYWEQQDTPLEDIERIEVIRGPGAALWGANAVNGVINIITKSANNTKGGLVSAGGGTFEHGFGTLRYGTSLSKDTDVRVYGNYANRGGGTYSSGNDSHDAWQSGSTGFRMDSQVSRQDTWTLQGDFFSGSFDENYTLYKLPTSGDSSYSWSQDSSAKAQSGNILTRWQRTISDTEDFSLQLYYDRYHRDMLVLGESRDTVDLDFQHRFTLGESNDLIWGLGVRHTRDDLTNTPFIVFKNNSEGTSLLSIFMHDEITLIPEKLSLILGTRLEHNDYSDFEIQPNARLLWTPSPRTTFWGSVSRAVRTPSRGDESIEYRYKSLSPQATGAPLPLRVEIDGHKGFASETVIAYELGYRTQPLTLVTVDTSFFYNQYSKLRVRQEGSPVSETTTNLALYYPLANSMHGFTYGGELSATWTPLDWWRLQAIYSYLYSAMTLDNGSTDETNRSNAAEGSPRHQGSLRSGFDLSKQVELDFWLRAVDRVPSIDSVTIPGYLTADVRLAWKPAKNIECTLVGQNLLRNRHPEYLPEFINTTPSEMPRSVYGKVTWKF